MINHKNISTREALIEAIKPKGLGIEIGVYMGEFSKYILDTCPDLNLILLDCWQEQPKDTYKDHMNSSNEAQIQRIFATIINVKNNYNRMSLIKGFSDDYAKIFNDNTFDFIFIDGNHGYDAVKKDLYNWYPKIKKGGLFCGHDYISGIHAGGVEFGVKSAVDEFGVKNQIDIYSTNESFPTWYFIK
jgi:predicted O-methyltransferase YrrM